MVVNCVAYKCNNLQDKRNDIQFHSFPFKRPEVLEKWIAAIRRANWHPSKTSRLCSAHFIAADYQDRPGASVKLLKNEAVPSIFAFPDPLQNKTTCGRGLTPKVLAEAYDKTPNGTTPEVLPPMKQEMDVVQNSFTSQADIISTSPNTSRKQCPRCLLAEVHDKTPSDTTPEEPPAKKHKMDVVQYYFTSQADVSASSNTPKKQCPQRLSTEAYDKTPNDTTPEEPPTIKQEMDVVQYSFTSHADIISTSPNTPTKQCLQSPLAEVHDKTPNDTTPEALPAIKQEMDVVQNSFTSQADISTSPNTPTKQYLRRKIKTLNQKLRRRNAKISAMAGLIKDHGNGDQSTENLNSILGSYFKGFTLEFLLHQHNNKAAKPEHRTYSATMKEFAQTMYVYSPKAYNFLRQHFILPDPPTVRSWLSKL